MCVFCHKNKRRHYLHSKTTLSSAASVQSRYTHILTMLYCLPAPNLVQLGKCVSRAAIHHKFSFEPEMWPWQWILRHAKHRCVFMSTSINRKFQDSCTLTFWVTRDTGGKLRTAELRTDSQWQIICRTKHACRSRILLHLTWCAGPGLWKLVCRALCVLNGVSVWCA